MSVKRGLGRSFGSLIPDDLLDEAFDPTAKQDDKISQLKEVDLADIYPDEQQPRHYFDENLLNELTVSIKEHGVLQPIVLTPRKQGGFVIVAGERRFRASQQAGLTKIPSLVRTLSAQHKLELSLIENIQRQDLNVLETATAYLKLRDQFNLTLEEIGARVGKSPSAISNTMRLLKLPRQVQEAVFAGQLTEGQVRPLIGVSEAAIESIIDQAIAENWTARKFEQWASQQKAIKKGVPKSTQRAPIYEKTEQDLSARYKMPINISGNTRGSGKIVISFKNNQEFDRIKKQLEA